MRDDFNLGLPSNGGPYLLCPVLADMTRRIQALELGRGLNSVPAEYRPRRKVEVTNEQHGAMCQLYVQGLSACEIARRFKFTPQTVINHVKAAGVHRQRRVA